MPRTCATRQVGASFDARAWRLRSKAGSVVTRYVNGSSACTERGSHATIPNPARLRYAAIILGLYDWRTSELSVSNSTCSSEIGSPRYARTRHMTRWYASAPGSKRVSGLPCGRYDRQRQARFPPRRTWLRDPQDE